MFQEINLFGELYFYYLPKGIIKKKVVNCYEVPSLFDIDEEDYSKLINDLYRLMRALREAYFKKKGRKWSNASITIENYQFRVEYGFEDLKSSVFNSYERHIIWRYKYLKEDINSYSKKDKSIIQRYFEHIHLNGELKKELYIEGVYKQPVKNIVDYEKTLTVDEAIAQSETEFDKEKKNKSKLEKKNRISGKKNKVEDEDEENQFINNQILNFGNKPK
ncbi:MAG: DUF600 family protein [Clostridia bacterium]|nr:DUF600 family protein [Clostridia bacterium]